MRLTLTTAAALVAATANACLASQSNHTGEVPAVRTYFYAGGQYVSDGAGGEIFRDQMYVEKLVPAADGIAMKQTPIVFIHGQAQTGTVRPTRLTL
jgi:hypothetical protein